MSRAPHLQVLGSIHGRDNMVHEHGIRPQADRFDIEGCSTTGKAVVTNGNDGYEQLEYRDISVPELATITERDRKLPPRDLECTLGHAPLPGLNALSPIISRPRKTAQLSHSESAGDFPDDT